MSLQRGQPRLAAGLAGSGRATGICGLLRRRMLSKANLETLLLHVS